MPAAPGFAQLVGTLRDGRGVPLEGQLVVKLESSLTTSEPAFIPRGSYIYHLVEGQPFEDQTGTLPAYVPITIGATPAGELLEFSHIDEDSISQRIGRFAIPDSATVDLAALWAAQMAP